MKLLVVEDDVKVAAALARGLRAEGFTVEVAPDGDDGVWRATEGTYDLIVLDIMLPGRNGYRVCADLRRQGDWTPVLMLTAKDGDQDEAEALDTGADDYLRKPFSFDVLVARIRALLRRATSTPGDAVVVGDLRVDPAARAVWRGDVPLALTTREFEVLEFLARRTGTVQSKAEILAGVWDFRLRGRPQHRRGVRPSPAAQGGRALRRPHHRDGPRRGLPPGRGVTPAPRPGRWPGVRSVRFRITLAATVAVAVVLVLAGIGLVLAQRRSLTRSLEESLTQEAEAIIAGAEVGEVPEVLDPAGDDDTVAQVVVGSTGDVVASTPNVEGRTRLVAASPPPFSSSTAIESVLEDGDRFLIVTRPVPSTSAPLVVSVGAPLDDVADATSALARSMLLAGPLVVALLAALVWWLVGRTLRPVEAIRAEVSEIGGSDLHRRVPVPPGDDEVTRLARTMNDMLARVESSAGRQQRFVADASHELRSPLTRIRTELEVDLAHPAGADPVATHRSVLEEVDGLQALVDDLLLLARIEDAPAGALVAATVCDLDDVVLDEVHRVAGGRVEVRGADLASAQVRGDVPALARAVRNVIENAVRHATAGVDVGLTVDDGWAVVTTADDGPGIPADRAAEVFERFARLDEARSGHDGGTGLGLAIAREVVERHGGTITVDLDHQPGACVVITLPVAEG